MKRKNHPLTVLWRRRARELQRRIKRSGRVTAAAPEEVYRKACVASLRTAVAIIALRQCANELQAYIASGELPKV